MDSPQTKVRAVSIVGTLMLAIALIFSGREHAAIRARTITTGEVSGVMMNGEHRSLSACSITTGVILRLNPGYMPSSDGDGGHDLDTPLILYNPEIVSRTAEGQHIQFTAADQAWQPGLKRGMQVRVAYGPDQPYEPRLVTYRQCFSNNYNLLLIGLFLLYIGLGYLLGPAVMEAVYR